MHTCIQPLASRSLDKEGENVLELESNQAEHAVDLSVHASALAI